MNGAHGKLDPVPEVVTEVVEREIELRQLKRDLEDRVKGSGGIILIMR